MRGNNSNKYYRTHKCREFHIVTLVKLFKTFEQTFETSRPLKQSADFIHFSIMTSSYFEKLKLQARQLDDNIQKLITTWKLPQRFIGGFTEYTKETDDHVEALWNTIKNTQIEIENLASEINNEEGNGNEAFNMEQFLQECTEEYNNIKTFCDKLDVDLAEYGYCRSDNDTLDETVITNGKKS